MDFSTQSVLTAFALTLFAGLSTGIGSVIAFLAKKTSTKFLSVMLGFSAGVMIYVSMGELLMESNNMLTVSLGGNAGPWIALAGFFGGMLIIGVIDRLVPAADNPHEIRKVEALSEECKDLSAKARTKRKRKKLLGGSLEGSSPEIKLLRVGFFTALAITIHNFPEGIAAFLAALKDPGLGISIAVAIAIHNIPEGIAVSAPVYYATNSRKKAFMWSLLSGFAEPLGALIGYAVLAPIMSDTVTGILFACIAGIMVFISLDEILPTAREYGHPHLSIYGMAAGMAVMAVSLLLI